jgi:hypothetical protein
VSLEQSLTRSISGNPTASTDETNTDCTLLRTGRNLGEITIPLPPGPADSRDSDPAGRLGQGTDRLARIFPGSCQVDSDTARDWSRLRLKLPRLTRITGPTEPAGHTGRSLVAPSRAEQCRVHSSHK